MTTTPATDIARPAAGTWVIDPGHSEVAFIARHLGLARVRGRFADVSGTVQIADDPAASAVDVTIGMASLDSGLAERDARLRSADFFDVEHHPTARFRSTAVDLDGTGGTLAGELTIRDVTRPVVLAVEHLGTVVDPWGNDRAAFSATTTVTREDWGLTWNLVMEGGGLMVSKQARLEIEVELVRR